MSLTLTDKNFTDAARVLACDEDALRAVVAVESTGFGFDEADRIVVRIDGPKFRHYTARRYDTSHPHLSHPTSKSGRYDHGRAAYDEAYSLDSEAALLSSSFGMFLLPGDQFPHYNFSSPAEMVDFLQKSENAQLSVFCQWLCYRGIRRAMVCRDFQEIAIGLYGRRYWERNRDGRLTLLAQRAQLELDARAQRNNLEE